MTNSATSTKTHPPASPTGFQAWHFFTLLSMVAATAVVMVSPSTHPVALLLLSAAVIASGFVGLALTKAVAGFLSSGREAPPLEARSREELQREKALVLRSIKELEFDKAMRKISDADFAVIVGRLRARAIALMQDLERAAPPAEPGGAREPRGTVRGPAPASRVSCPACGTANEPDARFCKSCGAKVGQQ